MGLKYSSADSQNLMTAMRNNLTLANQITDRLSSGCDHLISALDSGELKGLPTPPGKAYLQKSSSLPLRNCRRRLMISKQS